MHSLRYDAQAAREAALDDGRIEGRIEGAIAMAKEFSVSKSQVVEQLMKKFSLTRDQAAAAALLPHLREFFTIEELVPPFRQP